MNNDIKIFSNAQFGKLRITVDDSGEPLFNARDLTDALGIDRTQTRRLDPEDVSVCQIHTSAGARMANFVNEAGFYSLVLASKKPEAAAFKRWVTHEVLPAIRRTGGYIAAGVDDTPEEILARALIVAKDTLDRQKRRIAELEPKALFADAVGASDGTCLIGELAKMLRQNGVDIGQNRLFEWLRENGYLGKKDSNRNVPTQRAMDAGLFRIKETAVTHADGHITISRTPKVTGKGQRYFFDKFKGGAA